MSTIALSELLGSTVYDSTGAVSGRVREVALCPAGRPHQDRSADRQDFFWQPPVAADGRLPLSTGACEPPPPAGEWVVADGAEGLLLLSRDLLDQQVIDVHGRKVVRVNDVDFHQDNTPAAVLAESRRRGRRRAGRDPPPAEGRGSRRRAARPARSAFRRA